MSLLNLDPSFPRRRESRASGTLPVPLDSGSPLRSGRNDGKGEGYRAIAPSLSLPRFAGEGTHGGIGLLPLPLAGEGWGGGGG